jgi:hypothetical protein
VEQKKERGRRERSEAYIELNCIESYDNMNIDTFIYREAMSDGQVT